MHNKSHARWLRYPSDVKVTTLTVSGASVLDRLMTVINVVRL
jgi:hypothetical protein